jgi:uncharacterized membrane protein
MDRLHQHTLTCKACSAALKWVQRLQVRVDSKIELECIGDACVLGLAERLQCVEGVECMFALQGMQVRAAPGVCACGRRV